MPRCSTPDCAGEAEYRQRWCGVCLASDRVRPCGIAGCDAKAARWDRYCARHRSLREARAARNPLPRNDRWGVWQ